MNQKMKPFVIIALLAVIVFSVSISGCTTGAQVTGNNTTGKNTSLMVYCGAGMSGPMDEIAALYKQKYGVTIEYNYAGSGTLLSQMELTRKGDIFMPGTAEDFETAKNKSFVSNGTRVVYHVPVIAVARGNPKNITCLADLGQPGVKVVLGDSNACPIGKLSDKLLEKNKVNASVSGNVIARAATVSELVTYVALGQADAAIVWEDLYVPESMDIVTIPKSQNLIKIVPIGALAFSEQPDAAQQFVDFVASDEGKAVFEKHGFTIYPDARYQ